MNTEPQSLFPVLCKYCVNFSFILLLNLHIGPTYEVQ